MSRVIGDNCGNLNQSYHNTINHRARNADSARESFSLRVLLCRKEPGLTDYDGHPEIAAQQIKYDGIPAPLYSREKFLH
jgi:hypothetical protein